MMFLLIGKKQIQVTLALCLCVAIMGAVLWQGGPAAVFSPAATDAAPRVVVIDPGHGGEDGGAVAGDGTTESGVNLAVSLRLQEVLSFAGQETVLTRTEDVALYSPEAKTIRQWKVSDLKNRVQLINDTANAVLVSIHQNTLPGMPSVHGAQVFYNTVTGGEDLAKEIQENLNCTVNQDRAKVCKQIPSTIYLMKNVTVPAVLVECGFLSNPEETQKLQTDAHQTRLAVTIAAGLLAQASRSGESGTAEYPSTQ